MKALDLFCGAGGASMGLHRAGFEVVGVDINPQPHYPFEFHQADALTFPLEGYDLIWASPPCQAYSTCNNFNKREYLEAIPAVRQRLSQNAKPYIIENVVGAPLIGPIMLCGGQFGLRTRRHRLFESNVYLWGHAHHKCLITYGGRRLDNGNGNWRVYGHEVGTAAQWGEAMGINWMTKPELAQAIPPAYSEWLARQLISLK